MTAEAPVSTPIYYDGEKYRQGRELVRNTIEEIRRSGMSQPVKDAIIMLMAKAIRGTVESAEAVYETLTAEEVAKSGRNYGYGRESDLETDKQSLKNLSEYVAAGIFT